MSALDARPLKQLDWYFDVISPFAYLAHTQLTALTPHAQIRYVPVVFAGLLQHFGNVGPAEIAPKRQWTFEHCAWTAHTLGVPFNPPAAHPFNPIPLLRAIVAAGSTAAAVAATFEYAWVLGGDVGDSAAIAAHVGVDMATLSAPVVKAQLIANGQAAIAAGVFGVPSAVVDKSVFWGLDGMPMLKHYLLGDNWFDSHAYTGVAIYPQGVQRAR